MKRTIIGVITLIIVCFILNTTVLAISESKYVYDETNILSENIIDYVTNINNTTLGEYKYTVYVTQSTNGIDIEDFKKRVFYDIGLNTNENKKDIMFMIAIEDKTYALELEEDVSRILAEDFSFEKIITPDIIVDMENSDWEYAIFKVTKQIEEQITWYNNHNNSENSTNILYYILSFLWIIILFLLLLIPLVLGYEAYKINNIFKQDKVLEFLEHYNLDIHQFKLYLKANYDRETFDLDDLMYRFFKDSLISVYNTNMNSNLSDNDVILEDISKSDILKLKLPEIERLCDYIVAHKNIIYYHNKQELTKLKEVLKTSELNKDILNKVINELEKDITNNMDKEYTTDELYNKIIKQYREIEVTKEVERMLSRNSKECNEKILESVRNLDDYKDYINNKTNDFGVNIILNSDNGGKEFEKTWHYNDLHVKFVDDLGGNF